jgi:hypothetical protein
MIAVRRPPNMRVQRTRSSPSAHREPLTRHTLGGIKALLVAVAIGLLLPRPVVAEEVSLSDAQLTALAREAPGHTPEKLHWVKGKTFSWVVFTVSGTGLQLSLSNRIWDLLKSQYQVYALEADLPEGSVRPCEGGKCYLDGFVFKVVATVVLRDTVEVTYSDFEGPLAASQQTIRYRWSGSRWKIVKSGPLMVS